MARDVKHEAAKAVTKLGQQREMRKALGALRDAVKEETKTFKAPNVVYDLKGQMH